MSDKTVFTEAAGAAELLTSLPVKPGVPSDRFFVAGVEEKLHLTAINQVT